MYYRIQPEQSSHSRQSCRPAHPWRPGGSQLGLEKRSDKSFQEKAEEPLGTNSHQTISKCRLLIGHKKAFVLLCPISEQQLSSHFPACTCKTAAILSCSSGSLTEVLPGPLQFPPRKVCKGAKDVSLNSR